MNKGGLTREVLYTSERHTCAALGVARSNLRYQPRAKNDRALRLAIIRLAKQYGSYGYHKIAELLGVEGAQVNRKNVERI